MILGGLVGGHDNVNYCLDLMANQSSLRSKSCWMLYIPVYLRLAGVLLRLRVARVAAGDVTSGADGSLAAAAVFFGAGDLLRLLAGAAAVALCALLAGGKNNFLTQ